MQAVKAFEISSNSTSIVKDWIQTLPINGILQWHLGVLLFFANEVCMYRVVHYIPSIYTIY